MSNLLQRALTGLFFVVFVVFMLLFNEVTFIALMLLISSLGMAEFLRIINKGSLKILHYLFILFGALMVVCPLLGMEYLVLFVPVFALSSVAILLSDDRSWHKIGLLNVSLLYIPLPLMLLVYCYTTYSNGIQTDYYIPGSNLPKPEYLPLNLFILIWSSDTFAYISGKAFGKTKLFEAVSPGKTWEGLGGSAILTFILSVFLAKWFNIPIIYNLLIALLTIVFGTLGDLVESMMKREYGIKDSGNILPGHGGVLDRFDALLLSLPFTCLVYLLIYYTA